MILSLADFNEHKRRFRTTGEITPALFVVLKRLVRVIVFGSQLSPALAPGGIWNEQALEDALQGWYEKRLHGGGLQNAFDRAQAPRPFLNILEQSFRHYLQNERERTETGNILRRVRQLLREEPEFREWLPGTRARDAWWGLASWNGAQPYQGSDEDIVRAAFRTGDFTLFRYGHSADRLDPVLRSDDLKRFLEALFSRVGQLLTLTHLTIALERRFNLDELRTVALEETDVDIARPEEWVNEEEVSRAAVAALAEISERQAEVIFRRSRGATLAAVSEALRISISTVDNEVKRVGRITEAHASDNAPAARILEKMVDLLS
jgi:DNA-binding CsgD family transcriptional regulator